MSQASHNRGGHKQVNLSFGLFFYYRQYSWYKTLTLDSLSDKKPNLFINNHNQLFGLAFSRHFDISQTLAKIQKSALEQESNTLLLLLSLRSSMS